MPVFPNSFATHWHSFLQPFLGVGAPHCSQPRGPTYSPVLTILLARCPTSAPLVCRACCQTLAFTLTTIPGMPWGDQAIMVLPANVLNALAGLYTNSALEVGVTCAAVGWVIAILSIGGICVAQCYKERHGSLLPIKVREEGGGGPVTVCDRQPELAMVAVGGFHQARQRVAANLKVDICVCGRHITPGADKCFHLGVAAREFEVQARVCCLEGEGRRGRLPHENEFFQLGIRFKKKIVRC